MLKKTILAVLIYLLIGGTLTGLGMADHAKKCGEKVSDVHGYAEATLLWPAIIATGIVLSVMGTELEGACKAK